MKITVPTGEVGFTRESCLISAASLMFSADINLNSNSNGPFPTDVVVASMAAAQAQAQLAQAFLMLHDRLPL